MKRQLFQEQSPVKLRLMKLSSFLEKLNLLLMRIGIFRQPPNRSLMVKKSKVTMKLRMKLVVIQLKVKQLTLHR
jgi:hypothetical protein